MRPGFSVVFLPASFQRRSLTRWCVLGLCLAATVNQSLRSSTTEWTQAASVGGLCNSSLTATFLARRRIDFAARLHRLHCHWIAGAIACRTFNLSRLCVGSLFHSSRAISAAPNAVTYRAACMRHEAHLPFSEPA